MDGSDLVVTALDLSSTTDTLIVDGDADDTVQAGGFTDTGTNQELNGVLYDVYTNETATLWIDQQVVNVVLA